MRMNNYFGDIFTCLKQSTQLTDILYFFEASEYHRHYKYILYVPKYLRAVTLFPYYLN